MKFTAIAAVSSIALMSATSAIAGPEAEVLHWWTSGGEAKSVAVLQKEFAANSAILVVVRLCSLLFLVPTPSGWAVYLSGGYTL